MNFNPNYIAKQHHNSTTKQVKKQDITSAWRPAWSLTPVASYMTCKKAQITQNTWQKFSQTNKQKNEEKNKKVKIIMNIQLKLRPEQEQKPILRFPGRAQRPPSAPSPSPNATTAFHRSPAFVSNPISYLYTWKTTTNITNLTKFTPNLT